MSEFFMPAQCYDQIAASQGEPAAQALWEKNGGTGKFVNGMVAIPFSEDINGLVIHGHTEPHRR